MRNKDEVDKEMGTDIIVYGAKRESGVIGEMKVSASFEERQSDYLLLNSFEN